MRIAYIEDDEDDARAFIRSWEEHVPRLTNQLDVYPSGEAYLAMIDGPDPIVHDLILLDLNLPQRHGIDIGRELKSRALLQAQSILVVTASDPTTAQLAQELIGAEGWAEKPLRAAGVLAEIGKIGKTEPWYGIRIVRRTLE